MRRYDDPVEVRVGLVDGVEAPAQFCWHDRLWQVRALVAHWVETAPWWHQPAVRGLLGVHDDAGAADEGSADRLGDGAADAGHAVMVSSPTVPSVAALIAEQEVWRVDAGPGRLGARGVFELVRAGETGQWRLTGCED